MGIKISELPQQTTALSDEFQFPMIDDSPETKRVGFDVLYNSINIIPIQNFDNSIAEVNLGSWGVWNASDDCGTLNSVYVPNPSNFPNKILIVRNRNNFAIPIGNGGLIEDVDGSNLSEFSQTRSTIMISNGTVWYILSVYNI